MVFAGSLFELLRPFAPPPLGALAEAPVRGITSDSRCVGPGWVFVAIRGTRVDGHAHVGEAFAKGALLAIVERPTGVGFQWVVPNTRALLARLAARWYGDPTTTFPVVGVTGTNGKTTTTFLLTQAWEALGKRTALVGTVETRVAGEKQPSSLTTPDPLTLQRIFRWAADQRVDGAAIEVSSIALDQHRIDGTRFACVAFTNLTRDHLDYHGTMERYGAAKARLFAEFGAPVAVVNADDPFFPTLRRAADPKLRFETFSLSQQDASYYVTQWSQSADGLSATIRSPEGEAQLRSPLIGRHNLQNLLTVIGALCATGTPFAEAVRALERAPGAPGRLERVPAPVGAGPAVFVDYAHTDDALRNVLLALRPVTRGNLIVVFGCGGDRDPGKRPKMGQVATELADVAYLTSDNPRTEDPENILDMVEAGARRERCRVHRDADRRRAIHGAIAAAGADDIVLVAGKGHETYQIVGETKRPFDDVTVAREALLARLD
jgi:UDP-N-acetylmuramoyl-L-alanyl-D-glutamate--2,6-diaminopimelate ligase